MAEKQDVRENAMAGGTPVRLRGLDANGNSISPTVVEVAKALPKRNEFTITLEPGETHSLGGEYTYNTFLVYETLSHGYGCLVLLGWNAINVYGHSLFSNTDKANSICFYNVAQARAVIKNNNEKKIILRINVV